MVAMNMADEDVIDAAKFDFVFPQLRLGTFTAIN